MGEAKQQHLESFNRCATMPVRWHRGRTIVVTSLAIGMLVMTALLDNLNSPAIAARATKIPAVAHGTRLGGPAQNRALVLAARTLLKR